MLSNPSNQEESSDSVIYSELGESWVIDWKVLESHSADGREGSLSGLHYGTWFYSQPASLTTSLSWSVSTKAVEKGQENDFLFLYHLTKAL